MRSAGRNQAGVLGAAGQAGDIGQNYAAKAAEMAAAENQRAAAQRTASVVGERGTSLAYNDARLKGMLEREMLARGLDTAHRGAVMNALGQAGQGVVQAASAYASMPDNSTKATPYYLANESNTGPQVGAPGELDKNWGAEYTDTSNYSNPPADYVSAPSGGYAHGGEVPAPARVAQIRTGNSRGEMQAAVLAKAHGQEASNPVSVLAEALAKHYTKRGMDPQAAQQRALQVVKGGR